MTTQRSAVETRPSRRPSNPNRDLYWHIPSDPVTDWQPWLQMVTWLTLSNSLVQPSRGLHIQTFLKLWHRRWNPPSVAWAALNCRLSMKWVCIETVQFSLNPFKTSVLVGWAYRYSPYILRTIAIQTIGSRAVLLPVTWRCALDTNDRCWSAFWTRTIVVYDVIVTSQQNSITAAIDVKATIISR